MRVLLCVLKKILLAPVVLILWVLWVLAVVVERLYSFSHGIVLGLLVIPILLACFFRMWQNALLFAAVGAAGYLILALVVSIEVLLEAARASLIGMMKY